MKKYRVAVADTIGENDLRNGNLENIRTCALNTIIISDQIFYEKDLSYETINRIIDELLQVNPNFRFKVSA